MKNYVLCLIVFAAVLGGCGSGQNVVLNKDQRVEVENVVSIPTSETNKFNHSIFNLELPGKFNSDLGKFNTIAPVKANEYPEIIFAITDDIKAKNGELKAEELIEYRKNGFEEICVQTKRCPEMKDLKEITLDGRSGIEYVRYNLGRDNSSEDGFLKIFTIEIIDKGRVFTFESEPYTDLQKYDDASQQFRQMISTIKFN